MKAVLLICILGAALVLPALAQLKGRQNKQTTPTPSIYNFYTALNNNNEDVMKIIFGGMTPEEIQAWKEKQQQQNNGPPC